MLTIRPCFVGARRCPEGAFLRLLPDDARTLVTDGDAVFAVNPYR